MVLLSSDWQILKIFVRIFLGRLAVFKMAQIMHGKQLLLNTDIDIFVLVWVSKQEMME